MNCAVDLQKNYAVKMWNHPTSIKKAFMERIKTLSYKNKNNECLLLEVFLKYIIRSLLVEVESFLKTNIALKFNIELHAIYTKPNIKVFDNTSLQYRTFKSEMYESFYLEEFVQQYEFQIKSLKQISAEFQTKQGGWTLLQLVKVDVNLNKYQPLRGAGYISTPRKLLPKRATLNVENNDEFCFKWALISATSTNTKYPNRTSSYEVNIFSKTIQRENCLLNFEELCFPLQVKDILIFERHNPNISIHVFGYDEAADLIIGPYYKAKKVKPIHINLLYLESQFENSFGHYIWIKNFTRMVRSQLTHHHSGKSSVCDACFQHFNTINHPDGEEKHSEICGKRVKNVLSTDKCGLEFKNSIKVVNVPFVIYANSKCFSHKTENGTSLSYVFTYFVKCSFDDSLNKWCVFQGENATRLFAESLIEDVKYYYTNYSVVVKPKTPLTSEEKLQYSKNFNCCICSKAIPEKNKVKLHCRLTGNYRGAAHHTCAFNYRIPKKFPVIFHNLSNNDCLLLIKEFSGVDDDPVNTITLNSESYICFQKDVSIEPGKLELRFLNFSRFLPFSLDNLVQSLCITDFKTLKSTYTEENKFNLVLKKAVLPYRYLNSVEQFQENCLPGIEHFYDAVIDEECSPQDYAHAQNLWSVFECKTLEDYLKVCMEIDVLLITDVFENFRLVCRNVYNLDPCHYFSVAEFSWDAMLKMTDTKLSLPTGKEMILFLQKGIRGGLSKCVQMHSVANNKYLSDYDDKLPSKYLISFHANDLYGRVMTELLPQGNFAWETDTNLSLDSIPNDSEIGYIFEVDLEYPETVFETHKNLPFCSESTTLPDISEDHRSGVRLYHKSNYIIYYKNLQQCLKHGLKLKKIHRILKFMQSDWLRKYIISNKNPDFCNKNLFEAKVLKLMNTAIYEKIMEKPEKQMKIMEKWEQVNNKLGVRNYITKHHFSSISIHDENLVAAEFNINLYNHVPSYLEFIISELVKLKMYSFHYEYIMPKYTRNIQLNYVDTDSLIYTITTDDLFRDINNDIYSMINTADNSNCRLLLKTLGMMTDANDGVVLKEFIGFGSKMYSLQTEAMQKTNENYILKNTNCDYIKLSDLNNLLYKTQTDCDSIHSFKLILHHRYATMVKELALRNLYHRNNILCNETINKLIEFYYRIPFCEDKINYENKLYTY